METKDFNKTEDLILKFAEIKGIKESEARKDVKTLIQIMQDLILDVEHDGLDIYGFTRWEISEIPERERFNPKTLKKFISPKHFVVKPKVSTKLKKLVK